MTSSTAEPPSHPPAASSSSSSSSATLFPSSSTDPPYSSSTTAVSTISSSPFSSTSNTTTSNLNPQSSTPLAPETSARAARAALDATLHSLSSSHSAALHQRASMIHSNSSILETQETQLARDAASLGNSASAYEKLATNSRNALKEIGDVQNWAEMMERDLAVVEEALRLVDADAEAEG
ncbi:hypothetical protein L228DRAFT_241109 [Xylona heveae TC161]|uniref:Biogenesis of lysosome-related organelles complex 1 subunit 1 n=1 Tax=Xylona heveae (strain CBS 132557 / TC161) TaxID=1328760 RepID=A0A165A376_XYLHT|nr:hypothetical protein L228DRAFT_241109 [Xylona heveae TC161]KZF19892.1 hypothetical protein L228DRAFT_241109 [Xylona heveae TC161]